MANITINHRKQTIQMNKTTAEAASQYGTEEYKALQEVRRDYPTYRIVTVARKTEKSEFKGLTYEFMRKYIKTHDDEDNPIMSEFEKLTATSQEAKEMGMKASSYREVKDWFYATFPAIEKFISEREQILKEVADKKAKKLATAA